MSRTPVSFHDLQPSADDLAADSCKYGVAEFRDLASQAGCSTDTVRVDADRLFSLHLLQIGQADAKLAQHRRWPFLASLNRQNKVGQGTTSFHPRSRFAAGGD